MSDHRTVEAGKKPFVGRDTTENLKELKREFGEELKQFPIGMHVESRSTAEEIPKMAEV